MHTYDTGQKENMCTNRSIHCFADKCIRSQLPIVINNTPLRILQKIYTHSYKGFTNYVKHFIIRWHVWCQTVMYANHNGSFNLLLHYVISCITLYIYIYILTPP